MVTLPAPRPGPEELLATLNPLEPGLVEISTEQLTKRDDDDVISSTAATMTDVTTNATTTKHDGGSDGDDDESVGATVTVIIRGWLEKMCRLLHKHLGKCTGF